MCRSPQAPCTAAVTLRVTRARPRHAAVAVLMAHLSGTCSPRARSQQLLHSQSLSGHEGCRGPGPRRSLVRHRRGALFPESLQPGWICWRSPGERDEHLPCALPAAAECRETE